MHYRIYSLHPMTGKIMRAADLIAEDDLAAVRHGRDAHPGAPFEVWCGARLVHHVDIGAAIRVAPERDVG